MNNPLCAIKRAVSAKPVHGPFPGLTVKLRLKDLTHRFRSCKRLSSCHQQVSERPHWPSAWQRWTAVHCCLIHCDHLGRQQQHRPQDGDCAALLCALGESSDCCERLREAAATAQHGWRASARSSQSKGPGEERSRMGSKASSRQGHMRPFQDAKQKSAQWQTNQQWR